jgi:hypothetical protein
MADTVTLTMSGGAKASGYLSTLAKKLTTAKVVNVGFLEGATYPSGTNIAQVAFWNEFGTKSAPPRPFFRAMIQAKSPKWGDAMQKNLKATEYDGQKTLTLMGMGIKDQLVKSIADFTTPALSPVTLMLRKMKDQDSSLVVTGRTVGEARARVLAGEAGATGTRAKPLIDTGVLQRGVDFEVKL